MEKEMARRDDIVRLIGDRDGTYPPTRHRERIGTSRRSARSTRACQPRPDEDPIVRALMVGWFLKVPFADHERQEQHVRASGLDWVIARRVGSRTGPHGVST
jgi:hypothetical protein